jgi:hypothetical protein
MLLSSRKRFIFVHIYRTGGTSVTKALKPFTNDPFPRRFLDRILRREKQPQISEHLTAREIRDLVGKDTFESCVKFAFVRNPWDWQVSLYHFMRETPSHFQHTLIRSMATFEEYLEWRISADKHLQREFVIDDDGSLLVDFVGKFERFNEDFQTICQRIGIRASLPHLNRSNHLRYTQYYNPRTRALSAEHFAEDIEMFEYSFQ